MASNEIKTKNIISESAILSNNKIGESVKIFKNSKIKNSDLGNNTSVGDDTILYESRIYNNSEVNKRCLILNSTIGSFCYTGINTTIRHAQIGSFCSISWNVTIGGANHETKNISTFRLRKFKKLNLVAHDSSDIEDYKESCIIGNDVWISSNVAILRGVEIGNGAVIGAGAVITKNVEPYSIVAGVPGRKIKMRFDEETIAIFEKIKWWDWPIETINEHSKLLFDSKLNEETLGKLLEIEKDLKD